MKWPPSDEQLEGLKNRLKEKFWELRKGCPRCSPRPSCPRCGSPLPPGWPHQDEVLVGVFNG